MQNANDVVLEYIPETTWGETPSGIDSQKIRFTGESLLCDIPHIVSQEIYQDRQVRNTIPTVKAISGDINFEFSYGSFDDFIELALFSDWYTLAFTVSPTVSASGHVFTSTDVSLFSLITAGHCYYFQGFSISTNNGYHYVSSVSTLTLTTVSTLATENAGNDIWIYGDAIKNGTTSKSISIQRSYRDNASLFFLFKGLMIDVLKLNFTAQSLIIGTVSFVGQSITVATQNYTSEASLDVNTNQQMSTGKNIVQIILDSTEQAQCAIKDVSCNIKNNLRSNTAIGCTEIGHIGVGSVDVTGSFVAYFRAKTLYEKYLNSTSMRFLFTLKDSNENCYAIIFPRIKTNSHKINAGSANDSCLQNIEWTAVRDPTQDCTIIINRAARIDDMIPPDAIESESGTYLFTESYEFFTLE